MSNSWPTVRLGEVVRGEREPIGSIDGDGLPVLGVTNVDGVTQTGVEASDDRSKYLRLRPGRFVYNPYRINVGSLGLSGPMQNGICSPAYVVFVPTERIDTSFLYLFLKSARANQLINFHGNRGSVRSALRFDDLCRIEIPLPPLAEQRRVGARVEELAAQVNEARTLRRQAAKEIEALFASKLRATVQTCGNAIKLIPFTEIAKLQRRPETVRLDKSYREIGVYCFGRGIFHKPPRSGAEVGDKDLFEIYAGDLILQITFAWEGAVALAETSDHGLFGSVRYLTFRVDESICSPRYLLTYMKTPEAIAALGQISPGSAGRNRVLSVKRLKEIMVPVVPLQAQAWLTEELQAEVNAYKRLQAETTAELDALLPSILDLAFKGEL